MKTEVYSWRVSTEAKAELEREARRLNVSVSALLDLATRDWLKKTSETDNDEEEQLRLQAEAFRCFGAFSGHDASRSENVRQEVRQRLRSRRHSVD